MPTLAFWDLISKGNGAELPGWDDKAPIAFLVADPAGNTEWDGLHKAALPKDGFNLIFPRLLRLDLSTAVVCGVLEHSSHHPLPRPTWAAPCAPGS